ncbi:nucleotidyl transferase AbiEii/AbiGii toxin family protein [Acidobacteria bacterium AH-259-A15]|nr:nucleotidyl transferase AbiEii/AbiGii toxin family protein [Acidobacteria bacterium AH-259-A15]
MQRNGKQKAWHREVITPAVKVTLKNLHRKSVLRSFYLAGGTGLALHLGHRRSVDLDFFSSEPFDQERLLQKVLKSSAFSVMAKDSQILHTQIQGTKVSFLGYPYPVLFPFQSFLDVNVADPREIACMKISAISSRGTKRDFVDLYVASKRYGLKQLLESFKEKFAEVHYSTVHILKSLTYFDEAEKDPMPQMLIEMSWEEVKQFFTNEVPRQL